MPRHAVAAPERPPATAAAPGCAGRLRVPVVRARPALGWLGPPARTGADRAGQRVGQHSLERPTAERDDAVVAAQVPDRQGQRPALGPAPRVVVGRPAGSAGTGRGPPPAARTTPRTGRRPGRPPVMSPKSITAVSWPPAMTRLRGCEVAVDPHGGPGHGGVVTSRSQSASIRGRSTAVAELVEAIDEPRGAVRQRDAAVRAERRVGGRRPVQGHEERRRGGRRRRPSRSGRRPPPRRRRTRARPTRATGSPGPEHRRGRAPVRAAGGGAPARPASAARPTPGRLPRPGGASAPRGPRPVGTRRCPTPRPPPRSAGRRGRGAGPAGALGPGRRSPRPRRPAQPRPDPGTPPNAAGRFRSHASEIDHRRWGVS